MSTLITLAESGVARISPRHQLVRGAVAGSVLYSGFSLLLSLGEIGTRHFSLIGLLGGAAICGVLGGLVGAVFGGVLGRFGKRGLLAHLLAGLASSTVFAVPLALLAKLVLPINPIIAAGVGILGLGVSLGVSVWAYSQFRARAA